MVKSKTHQPKGRTPHFSRSESKIEEAVLTEKDVEKTYTGLDKEIAEQFIEKCETKKPTLYTLSSKTSCDYSSSSFAPTATTSNFESQLVK